jgi:hypothetical protein
MSSQSYNSHGLIGIATTMFYAYRIAIVCEEKYGEIWLAAPVKNEGGGGD